MKFQFDFIGYPYYFIMKKIGYRKWGRHMKILVAEDDDRLRKNIVHMILREQHQVEAVDNGEDALDYIEVNDYDLLVLDWMMPKLTGIDVCRQARERGFDGGILILTAKDTDEDIVQGLDNGADDYIVKPFTMEVFLARIRALLRRKSKVIEQLIQLEDLTLNKDRRTLLKDDVEIELTKNEFSLLEYLIINKGRVLTREQIFEYIWGIDQDVSNNALDALVKLVRKKIDDEDKPSYIQNVRGIGYKMRDTHVQ